MSGQEVCDTIYDVLEAAHKIRAHDPISLPDIETVLNEAYYLMQVLQTEKRRLERVGLIKRLRDTGDK